MNRERDINAGQLLTGLKQKFQSFPNMLFEKNIVSKLHLKLVLTVHFFSFAEPDCFLFQPKLVGSV